MKNTNKSDAYRNTGFGRIEAPVKDNRNSPKATVIKSTHDLRAKGGSGK